MVIRKAYKYRLEPHESQREKLLEISGCTRFVWNWMLSQRTEIYKAAQKSVHYVEQANQLKYLKTFYPFLKESPSQALQQGLRDLDQSFKNFFKGHARYPKFKRKGEHDRFRIPQGIEVQENKVKLPKLGWVKFRKSRAIQGTIKNVTLSKVGKHWYIAFCCEETVIARPHPSTREVGIDVGVAKFATLSEGKAIDGIASLKKYLKQLKRLQRSLSRKVRGSSNWRKMKALVTKLHTKISNTRRDHLHKITTELSKSHAKIYVEDLKIGNMSRSSKGTAESPGKQVKAKSGLNRSILDQSWGEFFRQLEYKLEWLGGKLIRVDPKHTSQKCSKCKHIAKSNRKSQVRFECEQCGYHENADVNAAKNILAAGQAVLACGDIGLVGVLAQESPLL